MDVCLFPWPVRADRPAPAVIPAVVRALAVEGVGLIIENVHAELGVPMAVATRWRREARGGAWQRFGGLGRYVRLAR